MNQSQNSWDDLIQNWNHNDADMDKELPSEQVLIDQINKQTRNDKIGVVTSLVAGFALASYIIVEMNAGLPSLADTILYSVFLLMSIAIGLFPLLSKKRSIQVSNNHTQQHINTLIGQSKNNLKTLIFSRFVCALALVVSMSLVGLIAFVALNKPLEIKHFMVGGIALGCSLLFVGIFIWLKKQKTQLEHQIEVLTSHLS
ncbi:hypothetical protein N9L48_03825 [Psychrosphaera sp.]|nr:hypothetical protein [Psychrosphaera sp.]